jgi:hypothetical protein
MKRGWNLRVALLELDFHAHPWAQARGKRIQIDGDFVDHVPAEGVGQR